MKIEANSPNTLFDLFVSKTFEDFETPGKTKRQPEGCLFHTKYYVFFVIKFKEHKKY